jgi:hypothetical protein
MVMTGATGSTDSLHVGQAVTGTTSGKLAVQCGHDGAADESDEGLSGIGSLPAKQMLVGRERKIVSRWGELRAVL